VRLTLPAVPASVARARHAAVALARALGAPERVVADVALAVSEACTNVVEHAYRDAAAPGALHVDARATGDGLLEIVVADEGAGLRTRPGSAGLGMGLALMAAVATGLELGHDAGATRVRLTFCLRGEEAAARDAESVAAPGAGPESDAAGTERD